MNTYPEHYLVSARCVEVGDAENPRTTVNEIDMLVGQNFLVSIHPRPLPFIQEIEQRTGAYGQVQGGAQNVAAQAQQAAQNVQPVNVARAAERVRNAAWGALVGSLLALGASAIGGALGTRREVHVDRATGRVSE